MTLETMTAVERNLRTLFLAYTVTGRIKGK